MAIFSWGKKKEKLVFVFDIRSSSVGGAIFLTGESGVPKIIFTMRKMTPLEDTLNVDKFLTSTLKSLEIAVNKIYRENFGKPDAIFCVLSSPWHISQTRVIKLERNAPFLFNSKLAYSFI